MISCTRKKSQQEIQLNYRTKKLTQSDFKTITLDDTEEKTQSLYVFSAGTGNIFIYLESPHQVDCYLIRKKHLRLGLNNIPLPCFTGTICKRFCFFGCFTTIFAVKKIKQGFDHWVTATS